MSKNNIVIIGAGKIGAIIAKLLIKNKNNQVDCWDKIPGVVKNQKNLHELVPTADCVILCVQAQHLDDALKQIRPFLSNKTIIATVTKGIETSSKLFVDQLIAHFLKKNQPYAMISGPMLSGELTNNHGGAATIGTKQRRTFERLHRIFTNTSLIVEHSTDTRGVATCGVLKNIYSFGMGVAVGLGWELNMRGWYSTHALNEMTRMVKLLGGQQQTVYTYAGIGDFLATSNSPESRNIIAGKAYAKKQTNTDATGRSEGFLAIPLLKKVLGADTKKFPVFQAIADCVVSRKSPARVYVDLVRKLS
jgi:glycerol-3-phosphate dehydrogenase (NAD(P)+)